MNLSHKVELKIDWATHESAKFACKNWHYSKCIPMGKQVYMGVWENNKFIGVVIVGRPAFPSIGKPYNLKQTEVVELTRIALTKHLTPVSRIISIALKLLKKQSPNLRLIVSMADPEQGHCGGIYQAAGWIYVGESKSSKTLVLPNGKHVHERTANHLYGKSWSKIPQTKIIKHAGKHKYLFPLDEEIRKKIENLKKSYPKRAGSVETSTSEFHSEGGGVSPTSALQLNNEREGNG